MNRRGFLKTIAGGAAAVGAAFVLPHAMPQETKTAVLPDSLAAIEPIGGASPVDFGPWNRAESYTIKVAGRSQAFPDYDKNWRIYEHGSSCLGVQYGNAPKPSADLVDW